MSDVIEIDGTEDQADNVTDTAELRPQGIASGESAVLGDFQVKPRRAHRRVRPIEDDGQADDAVTQAPAEPEPHVPPAIVSIANSRRGTHLIRLRADLISAQRYNVPMNTACPPSELARQAAVREQSIADAERRLAACEALEGWALIKAYKADETGSWRG